MRERERERGEGEICYDEGGRENTSIYSLMMFQAHYLGSRYMCVCVCVCVFSPLPPPLSQVLLAQPVGSDLRLKLSIMAQKNMILRTMD